jgi:hypothetical protein
MNRTHFEPPILGCCYERDEPFPYLAFFVTGFFTPYFQRRFKENRAKMRLERSCNRETTNEKLSSMEQSRGNIDRPPELLGRWLGLQIFERLFRHICLGALLRQRVRSVFGCSLKNVSKA